MDVQRGTITALALAAVMVIVGRLLGRKSSELDAEKLGPVGPDPQERMQAAWINQIRAAGWAYLALSSLVILFSLGLIATGPSPQAWRTLPYLIGLATVLVGAERGCHAYVRKNAKSQPQSAKKPSCIGLRCSRRRAATFPRPALLVNEVVPAGADPSTGAG